MTVYITLDDPQLPFTKVGVARCSDDGVEVECSICNKPLKILKDKLYEIIDVFCGEKCLSQGYEVVKISNPDVVNTKSQREACESCGGKPRGRGFIHNKGCPEFVEIKTKRHCEECHGSAIGRGYKHLDRCSKKISQPQRSIKLCPNCQGPARGRGFIHAKTCKGA